MLIKGILLFPTLFTAKVAKGATEAKYGITVLLPPTDPQVAVIQATVGQAKLDGCPSGYNGADECFNAYDIKYAGKEYYDPRFTGWWLFSCTKKEADGRPSTVDMNYNPIIDPGAVFSGMVGYVNAGISYYPKGKAGIGGWLNGVMVTAEDPPMGRLDGRPTVEQMFAGVTGGAPAIAAGPGAAPQAPPLAVSMPAPGLHAPAPQAPAPQVQAPAPAAPVALQMTALANGVTYEAYMAQGDWTDDMLIAHGLAIRPSFA